MLLYNVCNNDFNQLIDIVSNDFRDCNFTRHDLVSVVLTDCNKSTIINVFSYLSIFNLDEVLLYSLIASMFKVNNLNITKLNYIIDTYCKYIDLETIINFTIFIIDPQCLNI